MIELLEYRKFSKNTEFHVNFQQNALYVSNQEYII